MAGQKMKTIFTSDTTTENKFFMNKIKNKSLLIITGLLVLSLSCGPAQQRTAESCNSNLEKVEKQSENPDFKSIYDSCPAQMEECFMAPGVQRNSSKDLASSGVLIGTETLTLNANGNMTLSGTLATRKLSIQAENFEALGSILASESASIFCKQCKYAEAKFFGTGTWSVNGQACTIGANHRLTCSGPTMPIHPKETPPLEPVPETPVKKYIYIHVADINNWVDLFDQIIAKIEISQLYDKVDQIRIGYLGSEANKQKLLSHTAGKHKIVIRASDLSSKIYERITLHALHEDSQKEDFLAFYLHVKGVTKFGTNMFDNIMDWVDYMHYFLIERHEDCFAHLAQKNVDTVGVNLRSVPQLHYSGNMWWAKSTYLRTLPAQIGPEYLDPEMWIMLSKGSFLSLFDTYFSHYFFPFARENYAKKEKNHVLITTL